MTTTINASTSAGLVNTADTSGVLQLQTNSTTAVTIDASQNVGIGGTATANGAGYVTLGVNGTTAGIIEWKAGGVRQAQGYATTSQLALGTTTAIPFTFNTNNTEAMRIDSSGRVNIGQTASTIGTILEVASANSTFATGTPQIFARTTDAYAIDTGGSIGMGGVGNSGGNAIACYAMIAGRKENATSANYAGYMAFATSTGGNTPTERMRIDSSGNLLVGTTTTNGLITGIQGSTSAYAGYFTSNYTASNNANIMFWGRSGGAVTAAVRYKDASTSMEFYSPTGQTVAYTTSSDYRLKENIAPMTGALEKVTQLKPVTYTWKNGFGVGNGEGFIAHELQAVVPDCVTGEKDGVDKDGNPEYQGIDTSFLVAILTAAIQEQQALITNLTTRLAALEGAK